MVATKRGVDPVEERPVRSHDQQLTSQNAPDRSSTAGGRPIRSYDHAAGATLDRPLSISGPAERLPAVANHAAEHTGVLATDDRRHERTCTMEWKLELVVVPVTDVDRAKRFYGEQVGFVVDHDTRIGDEVRVVQLTPPGSACSIAIGTGLVDTPPGSIQGLQLVVSDIEAARAQLVERGVEASAVQHYEGAVRVDGRGGDWNSFVFFADPDGNGWVVQERPAGI
jgi:extradiol dioxygenase family protein